MEYIQAVANWWEMLFPRQSVGISRGTAFEQKRRTDTAADAATAAGNGPIYDPGIVPNDVRKCVPA